MKTEKMREAFETWWRSEMNLAEMDLDRRAYPMQKPDFEQPYSSLETERAWLSWQASRAPIEVGLPRVADYFDQSEYPHTCDLLERDMRASIEYHGLKVNP